MVEGLTTKEAFENMFPAHQLDTIGDQWLIKWRGSQTIRYSLCLEIVKHAFLKDHEQGTILDIGCAQSNFLARMLRNYPCMKFYGTDISDNAIRWNQANFPDIQYKTCALPDIGFRQTLFDFISALEVIYYLDEERQLLSLQNIAAALKPGGYLLISGVLDNGKSYFSEKWIVQAVESVLKIEQITFNYARYYTHLERSFLEGYRILNAACRLLELTASEFRQRSLEKNAWRWHCIKILRFPLLKPLGRVTLLETARFFRALLGWTWLPLVCFSITKRILKDKGKSHIIILARKRSCS